jgi:hypothetical protein
VDRADLESFERAALSRGRMAELYFWECRQLSVPHGCVLGKSGNLLNLFIGSGFGCELQSASTASAEVRELEAVTSV